MSDGNNERPAAGPDIIYTKVDEAPELASASFLPIIRAFTRPAGISVGTKDISLAGRILANFPDHLSDNQKRPDDLAELGELVQEPGANVIKLPNISASIPQINAAVKELRDQGYTVPAYPEEASSDEDRAVLAAFDKVKGSAVNPVLREGNSDRRAPKAVKEYAKKNPHRMGKWTRESKTHVSTMGREDFFTNEKALTVAANQAGDARIEFVGTDGTVTELKGATPIRAGDVVDATMMSAKALSLFFERQIADAKNRGVLFSVHLKATMMKVSDPIIFGHAVKAYLKPLFERHGAVLDEAGVVPDNGIGELAEKIAELPGRCPRRGRAGFQRLHGNPAAHVHGQLGQGRYQPPRALRRDHRRVHAGADPGRRQGLGTRRPGTRHQVRHPGFVLCRGLFGDHRILQGKRRLRSGDHGLHSQCRADGPEGGGVRLPPADLQGAGRRNHPAGRCEAAAP